MPATADLTVLLVSMPFMETDRPSIQLGLLSAIARDAGFPVRTWHANLDLAARIGAAEYAGIARFRGPLIGDWLFSVEAFGADAPDPDARFRAELADIRRHDIPAYLDALADEFDRQPARVVAFTCTFQQNTASFALARRLKQRHPGLITVFGGANFDGEMGPEYVRTVDCIDYAVVGEGDTAFPQLLTALADGTDPTGIPGVVARTGGASTESPPEHRLDDSPVPDYDEYFTRAARLGLLPAGVWIPVETSRGCWWGARHHCVFCGLNATSMRFRAKSPRRVRDELARLARRHGGFRFAAVDNILDVRYLTELLPGLVADDTGYQLFYEVKANLNRDQVRLLARAGVTAVQPGIESLSTPVLRLMRKGVTAAQNVNLLRWAGYYGIHLSWNILWGFPGETVRDYTDQAAAVPTLTHLQPPDTAGPIWMERFSPLHATTQGQIKPEASYAYVYPAHVNLDRIAYFFDRTPELPDDTYDGVRKTVHEWRRSWTAPRRPVLTYRSAPHYVEIYDGRHPGREGTYAFEDTAADVYLQCVDRPVSASTIHTRLHGRVAIELIDEILTEFTRLGLLFRDGPKTLALALPAIPGR
ncbi:RiPP maturation radical SAM C-methyltransferase [Actinoplanes couchii]|uniref:RiPP maturation radical SAM protein 1 n=1 Tax=Actinoplanes couchii TaxID=403638 RepID=A0ABQ3XLL3_9ACTN|nr:RiPP maturation radical SAM C-methyltransferase [Actinoplanes couchii]MDR6319392.1 ribosomal peptide maturation radical SAM protein 1 [Actinoplanes couchii]GID59397.1 RiPP maturation radical SAM protein 1 [Actinoplanes couchii]